MEFTYNGYEFEGRQTEARNIVWLKGKPNDAEQMPRSFEFHEVADHFLVNRDMPEYKRAFKKHIIIQNNSIDILRDGYNIIEDTIYGENIPQILIEALTFARNELDMDNMNAVGVLGDIIEKLEKAVKESGQ